MTNEHGFRIKATFPGKARLTNFFVHFRVFLAVDRSRTAQGHGGEATPAPSGRWPPAHECAQRAGHAAALLSDCPGSG